MTATASDAAPDSAAAATALQQAGDIRKRPPEMTVPEMLRRSVEQFRDKPVLLHKEGGEYRPITYGELDERVQRFALGLVELGVGPGARMALLSENRPEWAIADLAALSIGVVNVPLYATLPPAQVEYIVEDAGAEIVVASNQKQLAKVLEVRDRLPLVKAIVVMDAPEPLPDGVLTMAEVSDRGAARSGGNEEFRRLAEGVRPSDLASIIYTSGTTGPPKGAVLTHDNFMSNAQAAALQFEIQTADVFLSFLPLSHVFERMAGHYLPLLIGCTVAYAESIFTVQTNMVEVKPTVMASVPRLYESIQSRIQDGIAKQPERKRKFAEWAIGIGERYNSKRVRGESPDLLATVLYPLADAKVLRPIRERVTGGRLRFFISGGAPLPVATARFLTAIGLHIVEGYGLTETSPVICINLPTRTKLGTVGPPVPGVEVRIAPDGEILSRGPHIMKGYFNKPEETEKAIDADGWFHTGDIGLLDEEGFLKITDRKKDIIVLANGKNVAPQPIEARLKSSPYISASVLFGDRQQNIVALIVPDFDHLKSWAREKGLSQRDPEELVKLPEVKKLLKDEIEANSKELADFEKVRRFTLLTKDFSQEGGELTPTLKIKRPVVAKNYDAEIQSMYGGRGEG